MRYNAIRSDAVVGAVFYSRFMKMKIFVSFCMSVSYLLPIILCYSVETYYFYEHQGYAFIFLVYCLVWLCMTYLMVLEHKHNLTQVWYCHKVFWSSSLLFNTAFLIVIFCVDIYEDEDYTGHVVTAVEWLLSIVVVVFMVKTRGNK